MSFQTTFDILFSAHTSNKKLYSKNEISKIFPPEYSKAKLSQDAALDNYPVNLLTIKCKAITTINYWQ